MIINIYIWDVAYIFMVPHVQTQSNRVCNFLVILLWLMLPRDHFVSRFLYFTTAGVKCWVAAVKSCPVLHFSVVIFFWSFGIIGASIIKCWELSTAQAGARAREGCCTFSLSLMHRVCISLVILLWLMLPRDHFFPDFLFEVNNINHSATDAPDHPCISSVEDVKLILYF
jgi:hypothetical protein